MDVVKALLARHSVRAFKPEPVDKETIMKILEAANHSPSAGNSQPWEIFVAGGEVLEKIRRVYIERFNAGTVGKPELASIPPSEWPAPMAERMKAIGQERLKLLNIDPQDQAAMKAYMENGARLWDAPVLVVLCMSKKLPGAFMYDLGLLTQSMLLAAQEHGVDSIIATGLVTNPDVLHKELGIPDDLQIGIGVALGYPDNTRIINSYRTPRRPIGEAVTFKGI